MSKIYLDTGALVKLYILESGSEWVQERAREASALPINPLQITELKNAVLAAGGRGLIEPAAMHKTLKNFEEDLQMGRFLRETPDWRDVWQRADALAFSYTGEILCRTLDILHVALAERMAVDRVITGDPRQAALCDRIRLAVERIEY